MKPVISLIEALNAVKNNLASLNEQKEKGVAVIYVGEDLDVLLELCDRILVLCGGKANGMLDARTATKEEVGLRMTNLVQKEGK